MSEKFKFNPFTGRFDIVEDISQESADPSSPIAEQAWVRRNGSGDTIADGVPIGLLLALTYKDHTATAFTYDHSYRTKEGTTVRIPFDQGGTLLDLVTKTDDYTATTDDNVILCNKATAMTITLPAATDNTNRVYNIKNINVGEVTVDGNGAEEIDGATTAVLSSQYESIKIISDGTAWWIL